MQATTKGKQATKGQKQIYTENMATLMEFGAASAVFSGLYLALGLFVWQCSSSEWWLFAATAAIQLVSFGFMKVMAKAKFDARGQVTDAGMDVNDPTAFGEYCKDAIILTCIALLLALYSAYGFLALLALPGYAGYKFVTGLFLPWVFAPAPETGSGPSEDYGKKGRREKIVYRR